MDYNVQCTLSDNHVWRCPDDVIILFSLCDFGQWSQHFYGSGDPHNAHLYIILLIFRWCIVVVVHLSIPRRSDGSVVLLHLTTFPVANLQMTANHENFKVWQMNTASDMAADMHVECQVISADKLAWTNLARKARKSRQFYYKPCRAA